jgi:hypothetical protein
VIGFGKNEQGRRGRGLRGARNYRKWRSGEQNKTEKQLHHATSAKENMGAC